MQRCNTRKEETNRLITCSIRSTHRRRLSAERRHRAKTTDSEPRQRTACQDDGQRAKTKDSEPRRRTASQDKKDSEPRQKGQRAKNIGQRAKTEDNVPRQRQQRQRAKKTTASEDRHTTASKERQRAKSDTRQRAKSDSERTNDSQRATASKERRQRSKNSDIERRIGSVRGAPTHQPTSRRPHHLVKEEVESDLSSRSSVEVQRRQE